MICPKISVITVSFNSGETILETILSVNNQNLEGIEHIFIDGKSTDNTVEIIEKNSKFKTVVISEKDGGMYYALNKGLDLAKGDIISILNSDDKYSNDSVLKNIYKVFKKYDCGIVWGDTTITHKNSNKIKRFYSGKFDPVKCFDYGIMPPHPSVFVKKEIYDNHGYFNTKYRISSDYELLLRFLKEKKISAKYLEENLAFMQHGGISSGSISDILEVNNQVNQINKLYGIQPNFIRFLFKIIIRLLERIKLPDCRKYLMSFFLKLESRYQAHL